MLKEVRGEDSIITDKEVVYNTVRDKIRELYIIT